MLRGTIVKRATPKGPIPARIHAPDFLGINWAKSCWKAPYSNLYPLSICAGWGNRLMSSPIYYGDKQHRATRNVIRNVILIAPTLVLTVLFFLQADYYQCCQILYFCLMRPVPDEIEKWRKNEMERLSREKPGVIHKHKLGGQISIPGSERNVGLDEEEEEE